MFGFLLRKRRDDVQRILQRRMNRSHAREVGPSKRRMPRGPVCEIVWVAPCSGRPRRPDFRRAAPAVTRDMSPQGLSFIHTDPVTEPALSVALDDEEPPVVLLCTVEHCTELGYGFYQVGVSAEETLQPTSAEWNRLRLRSEQLEARRLVTQGASTTAPGCGPDR